MMRKIYILVPVHNRIQITKKFIDCLKAQSYQNYHLVLIDDGSTDGTDKMVVKEVNSLSLIKGKGNWWWGGSLQQGYKFLKKTNLDCNDFVLIINDDTTFASDFLEQAINVIEEKKRTLLLDECYSAQTNKLIDNGVYFNMKTWKFSNARTPQEVNCFSTRGLFFRIKDFYEIGGFHPWILPHYLSDYEFTFRAYRKGFSLVTDSKVKLFTNEFESGCKPCFRPYFSFLKQYFSIKHHNNPIYYSIFIALTCPWKWKIRNWFRVWRHAFKELFFLPFLGINSKKFRRAP